MGSSRDISRDSLVGPPPPFGESKTENVKVAPPIALTHLKGAMVRKTRGLGTHTLSAARGNMKTKGKGKRSSGKMKGESLMGRFGEAIIFSTISAPPHLVRPPIKNRTFTVEQMIRATRITSGTGGAGTGTFGVLPFEITSLVNVGTLGALFDQYRVKKLEYWFIPDSNSVPSSASNPGMLETVVDFDDASVPSAESTLLSYDNFQMCSGVQGQYRSFCPTFQYGAGDPSGFNSAGLSDGWVDAANVTVIFYGLKWGWIGASGTYGAEVFIRATTEWRSVR
jgi:hypothetical protein